VPPNTCGLSAGPISLTLNLNSAGTGTMTKTHVYAATTFTSTVTATAGAPGSINLTGTGSAPGGYTTLDSMTFVLSGGGGGTVSGTQQISGPGPCSSVYVISGNRPAPG
jgi:hypothetical protein